MNTQRTGLFLHLALGLTLVMATAFPAPAPIRRDALARNEAHSTLTDLPLDAQAAISTTLGRDDQSYHFESRGSAFRTVRGGLQVDLGVDGMRVHIHESQFLLALVGLGYGDQLEVVQTVQPQSKANRVDYAREGIREWYINGPLGLEQGFTLAAPPDGRANGKPLTLVLAASGLAPQVDSDGRGLAWVNEAGDALLRYHGLMAFDADGQPLPAWMEVGDLEAGLSHWGYCLGFNAGVSLSVALIIAFGVALIVIAFYILVGIIILGALFGRR